MGRRKKEPRHVHREAIAAAAQVLFTERGIDAASMDDIAKAAGYSKATLYVYFKNKEEIVGFLVLESMKQLYERLSDALEEQTTTKARYDRICFGLAAYQEEFPYYFQTALSKINIDFEQEHTLRKEKDTYDIGEEINRKMKRFLQDGIDSGELCKDLAVMPAIFTFWGMLSGLILMAVNKEAYIAKELNLSKQQYLTYGFDTLYRSIANTEVNNEK